MKPPPTPSFRALETTLPAMNHLAAHERDIAYGQRLAALVNKREQYMEIVRPPTDTPLADMAARGAVAVTRKSILSVASEIINKDRAATHGEAENSFQTIADYWSVYLSKEFHHSVKLTSLQVAQLMVLFKVARAHNNPQHLDNWVDQAGYTALAGEIAMKPPTNEGANNA